MDDMDKFQRLFDKVRRQPVAGPFYMWVARDGQVYEVTGITRGRTLANSWRKKKRNKRREMRMRINRRYWVFDGLKAASAA